MEEVAGGFVAGAVGEIQRFLRLGREEFPRYNKIEKSE